MDNILKAMKISGLIALICLFLSMLSQNYVYENYKEITAETNTAIKAAEQIVTYTYQYQLTLYKHAYNKQEYIDYEATYKNCIESMRHMLDIMDKNVAMNNIDPDGNLKNALRANVDLLVSKDATFESNDEIAAAIVSQTAMITSFLEIEKNNREMILERIKLLSSVLSVVLLIVCIGSVVISQRYAKSAEEKYQEQINRENYTDGLTGLLNQKYVTHVLPEFVEKSGTGYVYMFDMDNFKKLNDTCGHEAGDRALKGFAEVMLSNVRDDDMACRLGGDEFVLYASGLETDKDAISLAKRIQNGTKKKFAGTELDIVSISCGIAPVAGKRTFNRVKNDADKALYYVKENRKGTCHMSKRRKNEGRRREDAVNRP